MVEITFEYFVKLTWESTTELSHHDDRVVRQAFSSVTSGLLNQPCDEPVLWILWKSTIENVIKLDSQLSHHGDRVVRANIIFQCEILPSYRLGASSSLIVSSSSIVSPFFEFPMFNAVDSNIRFLNESSGDSKLFLGCVNVRCVF